MSERKKRTISTVPLCLFASLFSPERVELIEALAQEPVRSVSELARRVNRSRKAVREDLKILRQWGLIRYEKHGKRRKPVLAVRSVVLMLED
jgi:predicted transcriptional regulator